jgi:phosphoglycerate dehydrogenase-like enzyme
LVPLHSKELFEQLKNPNIKPIFYRLRQESFLQKGMRKLGLRGAGQTLAARFEFIEEGGLLGETYALWLSPAVRLPPSQMACLLDLLPKLRWVYSQITGIDHLEPGLFTARGVLVSNSGRLSSRRMAEMALATILAHAKRLPEHIAMQRRRRWTPLASSELYHQTVGIIGTGNIGNELAKLCRGIGLHVIGASREPGKFAQNPAPYDAVVSLSGDLEGLLAKADHVVLALPLNQQTRGLIGTTMLGHMKKNSSLINLARGELVVEDELCNALSKGKIGAAYIDLPAKLPLPVWSRLYRTPNLILTHNSAAKSISLLAEAFEQFLRGLEIMTQTGNPPDRVI